MFNKCACILILSVTFLQVIPDSHILHYNSSATNTSKTSEKLVVLYTRSAGACLRLVCLPVYQGEDWRKTLQQTFLAWYAWWPDWFLRLKVWDFRRSVFNVLIWLDCNEVNFVFVSFLSRASRSLHFGNVCQFVLINTNLLLETLYICF